MGLFKWIEYFDDIVKKHISAVQTDEGYLLMIENR